MSESVTTTDKPAVPAAEAKPAEAKAAEAKPAAEGAAATPEAPAVPEEKPFCPDVLTNCTSRYSRKTWDLLLKMKNGDVSQMTTVPLRAKLTARTPEGAAEIHQTLMKEKGVTEIKLVGKEILVVATFADIQAVIKHPQTSFLDASLAE